MTNETYDFEYPDEAGYPDGVGTLSETQVALADEVSTDASREGSFTDLPLLLVQEPAKKTWSAIVEDEEIGDISYDLADDGRRVILKSTTVYPDYRGQGVASEMIRRLLVELRKQGVTATIECPIVRTFIDQHPEFADVVDPHHPGILRVRR